MRINPLIGTLVVSVRLLAQTTEVGAGAPNEFIRTQFLNAYHRGGFAGMAGGPLGPVRRFGATGLIQEFQDAASTAGKLALVRSTAGSNPEDPTGDVFQVLTAMYAYYTSVGVNTAGYPTNNTLPCPSGGCQYQLFDKKYGLFVFSSADQNATLKDPYYSRWEYYGGITGMGAAASAEQAVTAPSGTTATLVNFTGGALYNITSGSLNGRFVSVRQPVFSLYQSNRAHTGILGLPAADEVVLPNGKKRQVFEGGSIEYDPNSPAVIRPQVANVYLRPAASPLRLNLGDTATLQAFAFATDGSELTDRTFVFSTSNSRVLSLQTNGPTLLMRAVGGGTATVLAASEGKSSTPVSVIVSAPCCQPGEGAPTAVIQQAFVDAVTRGRLTLKLPAGDRVRRAGAGYVQEFQTSDGKPVLIALSDRTGQAVVVLDPILSRYLELGGPAQSLGYPLSDATAGGRQTFEGGTLAGLPTRLVTGSIFQKWSALGFEAGVAGSPTSEASTVQSFTGITGQSQSFSKGMIVANSRGAAYLVGGPPLTRYMAAGGPGGTLGLPLGDEVQLNGKRRQEFEGGYLEYAPGESDARLIEKERRPEVTASPAVVFPGARLRITIAGFAAGANLRVSVTGQPDFLVRTVGGSYVWDLFVLQGASAGQVRVRAVDSANTSVAAETTYTVRSTSDLREQLTKASGDTQTAAPGTMAPLPLRALLRDEAGNAIPGVTVRFSVSPGAEVTDASVVTDVSGLAETRLRVPASEGVALVTAEAMRQVVTFSARAAASSLTGFPKFTMTEGALLPAVAAILRFHQNRGELPSPNGLSEPSVLNQFLRTFCVTDSQATQVCDGFLTVAGSSEQVLNLWRAGSFAGSATDIMVDKPQADVVKQRVAEGTPVLLALALVPSEAAAGSHFVVATGIAADGSVLIHDPSPQFGRTNLNHYLNGFTVGGREVRGRLSSAVRILPRVPSPEGFVVVSTATISVTSAAGECGSTIEWPLRGGALLRQRYCDGRDEPYQVDLGGDGTFRAVITDLASGGSKFESSGSGTALRVTRSGTHLVVGSQLTALTPGGIVNAATFTPDIAAGGLVTIFGAGLFRTGSETKVFFSGRPGTVVAAFPFQINAQVPPDVPPGQHAVRVESSYGVAELQANILPVAPAIFRGAVANQNGTLNSPIQPARRGEVIVIYGTGFGMTHRVDQFAVIDTPVMASIGGQPAPVSFAGLAPGFIGLYQLNVQVPMTAAPGVGVSMTVRQGNFESRPVEISIQ